MQTVINWSLAAFVVLALAASQAIHAAELATTAITVEGMHCPMCAKKIAKNLYRIRGVAAVQADVAKALIVVTPRSVGGPSPRAMWDAVEKAGYTPTKLHGPGGNFTEKPSA